MAQGSFLAMLQPRDIGFATTSNLTCARPLPNEVGSTIFGSSSLTFQHLMVFISAGCLGITILSTLFLNWRHLHHYSVPQEQRQILRIINLPAAYGIFNFLLIFGLLNGKLFSPSAVITYNDINFGVPAFLTSVEAVVFSLIFHWAYRSKEYQDGHRLNRLGGVAQRTSTLKAILDALNPSDIIVGTTTAVGLLFTRVQSRYGARSAPQREKLLGDSNVGMEPLSYRSGNNNNSHRMRGYSGGSDPNEQQSPPLEEQYEGGLYEPAMPRSAQDPSAKGRARSQLRPAMGGGQEYQPLTRSRDPSPSGADAQYPRAMV
ncbi:hypothetical protein LTR48_004398 [Friedmanniomyces endolithicus]|nr:hypothetical protein LTR48_004398 [Friedmanniomyces endolithicus]